VNVLTANEPTDSPRGRDERARSGAARADGATRREARGKPRRSPEPVCEPRGKLVSRATQREPIVLGTLGGRANRALPLPELGDDTRCAENHGVSFAPLMAPRNAGIVR
jgi:hypothetical protein